MQQDQEARGISDEILTCRNAQILKETFRLLVSSADSNTANMQVLHTKHFDVPVVLEDIRPLGAQGSAGYECRVPLPDGAREDSVVHLSPGKGSGVVYSSGRGARDSRFVRSGPEERLRRTERNGHHANVAGIISIHAKAQAPEGYDAAKLENGVFEPLRELELIDDD